MTDDMRPRDCQKKPAHRNRTVPLALTIVLAALIQLPALGADAIVDLARLSLEELSNVQVTSVSKSAERLRDAPASIYVISREDIVRSGATSIPEALRLAPNLEMRQQNANSYVAAARGLIGQPAAQNFSNKLLLLIDGRSVYTPLFSGVYFDAQDVVMNDIERIEVISGPGATLWGANAMNGVINIITRSAHDTQNGFLRLSGGNFERHAAARYGNAISDELSYRVYGQAFKRDQLESSDGVSAEDAWHKMQGGFRFDWTQANDTLTVQGDGYRASQDQRGPDSLEIIGANALTRWQHRGENSELQVQAYVDQTQRGQPPGGVPFVLHTYDLEIQQALSLGERHRLIGGVGKRMSRYSIGNSSTLLFLPSRRQLDLNHVFLHDTIAVGDALQFTVGVKFEDDPFSGWSVLPDARLSWRASEKSMLWAAAARAVRSPTPFDHDVVERVGGVDFLVGNTDFEPEQVDAYEIGYRGQPIADFSISISAFYNEYDDLRTIEPAPATFLPLHWGNLMGGETYGVEAWGKWQITDRWRLSPGVRALHKKLTFARGASRLLGVEQAGNDPSAQASLGSSLDLTPRMTFDMLLRYVGRLSSPRLDEYYDLNARFGWRVNPALELAVTGLNLLHARHRESPADVDAEIGRSVMAEIRWTF